MEDWVRLFEVMVDTLVVHCLDWVLYTRQIYPNQTVCSFSVIFGGPEGTSHIANIFANICDVANICKDICDVRCPFMATIVICLPDGDQGQNKKVKIKRLYLGKSKARVLHKEMCAQSLQKPTNCGWDKRRNKTVLHKDNGNVSLILAIGHSFNICTANIDVAFTILDTGHFHMFVQWMSTLYIDIGYWTFS